MVFYLTRRQLILLGMLCLSVICLAFVPQVAFAGIGEGITKVVNVVVGALMKGLEIILGLFQFLFLQVIEFTILDFAKNWNDGGLLSDFRVVWQVLRDFVNLVIVVLFVITAMMISFGGGRDGGGQFGFHRKGLVHLILAAVFVNFSAFFTLLVIDISHILFMLFFNALDASSWGSFSPFSGYSVVLGDVATGMFNIILGVIAIVVNWFIILGILYFCIILIERYIIAMFLVLLSPLAALGFFASMSGGNPLTSKFVGVYNQWTKRLGYVFSMPVVLILGLTLLLVLFRGALGQLVEPDNFVKLIGLESSEGRGILLQLVMASIVLILGIFKVGEVAKKANIHSAVAGKFKFGEIASKLVGPKAQLGLARTASQVIGNNRFVKGLRQRGYENRKKWREEGSVLADIPGIGKPLDVRGKVRRAGQTARSVARGVDAVAGGQSGLDVAWQSAEATEDKRIWDVIHSAGNFEEKENLLKQALDPKSKVTLNEQQTAVLARNPKLHSYLASLDKGVSQNTYRRIFSDTQKWGKEVASERDSIKADKHTFSDEYKEKQQKMDAAIADFERVQHLHQDLEEQKNLAQVSYDEQKKIFDDANNKARSIFEQSDAYKEFQRGMREHQRMTKFHERHGRDEWADARRKEMEEYEKQFLKDNAPTPLDDSVLQEKQVALQGLQNELREVGKEKDRLNGVKNEAGTAFRAESDAHKSEVKTKEDAHTEKQKEVAQRLSALATNTGAGSVAGSAAATFSPDELVALQEERKQMTAGTQKEFAAMQDAYAKSSAFFEGDVLGEEQQALTEENKKDIADLTEKKSEYYQQKVQDPNLDTTQLEGEIDTLKKAVADRHARSLAIDEQKGQIKKIRKGLAETDATDARKLDILSQSISSTTSLMQDGTKYLDDQLSSVTQKISDFEDQARQGSIDLDTSDEYKSLQEEKSNIDEHLDRIGAISQNIELVKGSLDEQQQIVDSPAYQKVLTQEKYLTMFSAKTLLADIKSALKERKKEFEAEWKEKQEKEGITGQKMPKNAYREDPAWKALDQQKKNIEKIQQGGVSTELQQKAIEEAKKNAQRPKRK